MIRRRELIKKSLAAAAAALACSSRSLLAQIGPGEGPMAETTSGVVRGTFTGPVCTFRGIHYGESPEGAGRFRPAAPHKPWDGIFDAVRYGTMAPQNLSTATGSDIRVAMGDIFGPGGVGEDCLVLNVWTPSVRSGRRRKNAG